MNFVMFLVSKNRDDFLTSSLAVSQVDFLPVVIRALHLFSILVDLSIFYRSLCYFAVVISMTMNHVRKLNCSITRKIALCLRTLLLGIGGR